MSQEPEQQPKPVVLDLSQQAPVVHRWIDRGLKLSCEDAGHPMHQAWKRGKGTPIKQ